MCEAWTQDDAGQRPRPCAAARKRGLGRRANTSLARTRAHSFRGAAGRAVTGSRINADSSPAEKAFHNVGFTPPEKQKKIPFFENTFHMPKNNLQAIENQRIN
jgi:hypothetical protein